MAAEVVNPQSSMSAPIFSHDSGFYAEEFDLVLSHPDPAVRIYYTLDGSDPDPDNLNGSTFRYKNEYAQPPATEPIGEFFYQEYKTHLYTKPLRIVDRTFEPDRMSQISTTFDKNPDYFPKPIPRDTWINIVIDTANTIIHHLNRAFNQLVFHYHKYVHKVRNPKGTTQYIPSIPLLYKKPLEYLVKGTPVRSVAISATHGVSEINSKVFFIGDQKDFSLPIINITVPEKDLFDYDEGIFVAGIDYDQWIKTGREDSGARHHRPANWKRNGDNILAYLNIFDQGKCLVGQKIDIRLNGEASRAKSNKSIRIYPRKKYSSQGIQYPVFNDNLCLGLDRIILRNSGTYVSYETYFANAAIQQAVKHLNFDTQRYRPFVVFINGEYYGLLNARDRIDRYYLKDVYDLPTKNISLLENKDNVKYGEGKNWYDFIDFLKISDPASEEFYRIFCSFVDEKSFIDYYCTQMYIVNTDWPSRNIEFWRYQGDQKYPITKDGFTDGRWRWILSDIDNIGGKWGTKYDVTKNMLEFSTAEGNKGYPNPEWSTFYLRILLQNFEFKLNFIVRFSDLINATFNPSRIEAVIRDAEKGIEKEMPRHIARWNAPKSMKYWRESVNKLVEFFEQRPDYQWQHLQDFFHLDSPYNLEVDIHQPGTGKIKVNTLLIGDDPNKNYEVTDTPLFFPWSGQYFKSLPLTLEAVPAQGYQFSHWEITGMELSQEEKQCQTLVLKPTSTLRVLAVMVEAG